MNGLEQAARVAVEQCMGVRAGEPVLVVTDGPCRSVGRALWSAAVEAKAEAVLVEIVPRTRNGEEPPPQVAEAMRASKVVLAPTSRSISHTRARHEACKAGARIATLPGISEDCMCRTMAADYRAISSATTHLAERLRGTRLVRVTSPGGTDVTLSLEGREARPDTGICHAPGQFCNLPAGEVYVAPVEGSARGRIVIDGSMSTVGLCAEPIVLEVVDGIALEIRGSQEAARLSAYLAGLPREAAGIAELGIGTNPAARVTGLVLEDEKVAGTVHFGFGNNATFGGVVAVPSHLDGVILCPTVIVDGRTVMKDGKLIEVEQ